MDHQANQGLRGLTRGTNDQAQIILFQTHYVKNQHPREVYNVEKGEREGNKGMISNMVNRFNYGGNECIVGKCEGSGWR